MEGNLLTEGTQAPNSARRILLASMIGTTIEYFDFYIYATAAVLVFPRSFFPKSDPKSAMLQSLATFALAFFARPFGSALFGHFGDRIGRKATLIAALLTMGISTVVVGILPTYATIGVLAPVLLAVCRVGQGLGLGGEWGGAVLLATENAPPRRQFWYGMFPQLGAPLGFIGSTLVFLGLSRLVCDQDFYAWGWRLPFLASAPLVGLGLYVRLRLTETMAFQRSVERGERVRLPLLVLFKVHGASLVRGTCAAVSIFVLFYLLTVFALGWGTTALKIPRQQFLVLQVVGILFFGLAVPLSAVLADRFGPRKVMVGATLGIFGYGFLFQPLCGNGTVVSLLTFLGIGFSLMGLGYGALSTVLARFFPTPVRYTGASVAFNLAGVLGGSLAPYIATSLAASHGLSYVGYYLSCAALVTLISWIGRSGTELRSSRDNSP